MKLITLVLVILSPVALAAQGKDPIPLKNQSTTVAAAQPNVSMEIGVDEDASEPMESIANQPSYAGANSPQQTNANPSPPTPPPAENRQKIPGSMVGYIDNPIVQNQIRIRFDAAFEDQFPDRSEFFYAKCGCYRHLNQSVLPSPLQMAYDPNAPGPGLGVPNSINFQQLYMNLEYSPQRRFSGFVEVPIRWLQAQGFQSAPPAWSGFPLLGPIRPQRRNRRLQGCRCGNREYLSHFAVQELLSHGRRLEGFGDESLERGALAALVPTAFQPFHTRRADR